MTRTLGRVFATAVSLATLTAGAPSARAGEEETPGKKETAGAALSVDGGRLFWRSPAGREPIDLGCEATAVLVQGEVGYVACSGAGVVKLVLGHGRPELLGTVPVGGRAVGLLLLDGQIWVQIERREARPVSALAQLPAHPEPRPLSPAPAPAAVPAPKHEAGRVVELREATAVIDLGLRDGLTRGDRVELFVEEPVSLGSGEVATREDRVAVVEVVAASPHRAQLRVGQDERIPLGARARATTASLTESKFGPPRLGGMFVAEYVVRPFLALGTLGVGSINEATLGYRFDGALTVEALLEPLGVGKTEETSTFTGALSVVPSYDTRYFQVGFGAGVARVPGHLSDASSAQEGSEVALSLAQVARLGARDGIQLRVNNSFLLYQGEFKYGGTSATFMTPIGSSSKLWLLGRGGGGVAGYGFGEVGLRIRARGNGDRGSLYLSPSLGGAVLTGDERVPCSPGQIDRCVETRTYAGPMVGFGMEWRL